MSEGEELFSKILNSPESMAKIAELAESLRGSMAEEPTETKELPPRTELPLSPELVAAITNAAQNYTGGNRRTKLLEALRPFAHGSNGDLLDRAANAVRIAGTARVVLNELGGIHLV